MYLFILFKLLDKLELGDGKRNQHLKRLFIEDGDWKYHPISCRGILQTIGFKEFANYLALNSMERDTDEGRQMLVDAIEQVKISTRKYARRQVLFRFA